MRKTLFFGELMKEKISEKIERQNRRLKKNGMKYMFGDGLGGEQFLILKLLTAVFGMLLAAAVNKIFMIPAAVLGYELPDILAEFSNEADNREMLDDIRVLYDTVRIQSRAGVFVTVSVMDCYLIVAHPRLKAALLEFNNHILAKNSLTEAVDGLESRFDNRYIDSFCIVLKQAMVSGKSVQILTDLSNQMSDVEHALRIRQREKLDRQIQLLELLLFTGLLVICIYGIVMEIIGSVEIF